ncbi:MAG: hypothetical protein WC350_03710 [Candidatus Micrarchaeia archaeon]|jgi:hypothetical protein
MDTYETLNRSWKSLSRILFGEEMGEMKDYEEWLRKYMERMYPRKSAISGEDVYIAVPDYSKDARFISMEEIPSLPKPEPLGINQVKDIDSIISALQERFLYSGNVILSNSRDVHSSTNVQNSFHVLDSNFIIDSEYIAHSSQVRNGKHLVGCNYDAYSSFMVNGYETFRNSRCFELWKAFDDSDTYYTFGAHGCQNVLFSFNIKNKKNMIGNIEFQRDEFASLKGKLLSEMGDELKRKKRLPSLLDMISMHKELPKIHGSLEVEEPTDIQDKKPIEDAFTSTSKIVLGKELHGIDAYGKWLSRHICSFKHARSVVSGKPTLKGLHFPYRLFPEDRLVTEAESFRLGEMLKLDEGDLSSFQSIQDSLWKIAFFISDIRLDENRNMIDVATSNHSQNCYNGPVYSYNQYCAFCFWPRSSKYVFGSSMAFSSSFCIRAHNSLNLSRCFEVDSCSESSDLYFSHNCENVHDSMFCFNSKNLRHAIGDSPLPPEKYKSVKSNLLAQIYEELEKKKEIRWDVFNLGSQRIV